MIHSKAIAYFLKKKKTSCNLVHQNSILEATHGHEMPSYRTFQSISVYSCSSSFVLMVQWSFTKDSCGQSPRAYFLSSEINEVSTLSGPLYRQFFLFLLAISFYDIEHLNLMRFSCLFIFKKRLNNTVSAPGMIALGEFLSTYKHVELLIHKH